MTHNTHHMPGTMPTANKISIAIYITPIKKKIINEKELSVLN